MKSGNLGSAKKQSPRLFYGYIIVFCAFFIILIAQGTYYSFGVFFESVLTEFGWTRALTSGAFSVALFLHGFVAVGNGRLNDRFGSRLIVTVSGFLLGLGYILMAQVSSIGQFYLYFGVIIGVAMGGFFVPLASTVARWFTRRRGLMSGIFLSGIGTGTMIMPPVARLLISNYGWRLSYTIFGVLTLVFILVLTQFLRRDPGQMGLMAYGEEDEVTEESVDLQERGFSVREALCTRQFWMIWAVYFSLMFSVQVMMVHVVIHATGMGISAINAASIPAIIGGVSIAGRVALGGGADRIGSKRIIVMALFVLSAALFWLLTARELWMLYLFATVFGFAYGGLVSMQPTVTADLFGLRSHGVILGLVFVSAGIGGAVGPVVVGHLYDVTSSYQPGFLVCAIIAVACAIQALYLKPVSKGG